MIKQIEFRKNNRKIRRGYYDPFDVKDHARMMKEGYELGANSIWVGRFCIVGVNYNKKPTIKRIFRGVERKEKKKRDVVKS